MKQVCTTVYTLEELKEQFPKGYEKALRNHQESAGEGIPWCDEIMGSLKGLLKASGVDLRDWSIGVEGSRSYIKIDMTDSVGELTGPRAAAWLENNLLAGLRVKPGLAGIANRVKYGLAFYGIGKVPPCPFTGYCADDDLLDYLQKAIRDGESLYDAFRGLAGEASRLMEAEYDYACSEEAFQEEAEANEYTFTEAGDIFG